MLDSQQPTVVVGERAEEGKNASYVVQAVLNAKPKFVQLAARHVPSLVTVGEENLKILFLSVESSRFEDNLLSKSLLHQRRIFFFSCTDGASAAQNSPKFGPKDWSWWDIGCM